MLVHGIVLYSFLFDDLVDVLVEKGFRVLTFGTSRCLRMVCSMFPMIFFRFLWTRPLRDARRGFLQRRLVRESAQGTRRSRCARHHLFYPRLLTWWRHRRHIRFSLFKSSEEVRHGGPSRRGCRHSLDCLVRARRILFLVSSPNFFVASRMSRFWATTSSTIWARRSSSSVCIASA